LLELNLLFEVDLVVADLDARRRRRRLLLLRRRGRRRRGRRAGDCDRASTLKYRRASPARGKDERARKQCGQCDEFRTRAKILHRSVSPGVSTSVWGVPHRRTLVSLLVASRQEPARRIAPASTLEKARLTGRNPGRCVVWAGPDRACVLCFGAST